MKLALALVAALALTACGAKEPATSAAEVAPASTYALIDGRSTQRLDRALAFLPEAAEVRRLLARAVAATGAGPKPTLAVLDARGDQVVALTRNELEDLQLPHARVRGWTVFSRSQAAVDVVRTAKARAAWARPAEGDLVFVKRGRTVTADDDGERVTASRSERPVGRDAEHPLAAAIPDDAVLAAAFHDGARVFGTLPFAAVLRKGLGLDVRTLAAAAPGDAVLSARTATPAATVTLLAHGDGAGPIVRELSPGSTDRVATTVDGVPATEVPLGVVSLFYGKDADTIFVTDDPGAKLRARGEHLEPAGLPAATRSWAYLDVPQGMPALRSLALLAGTRVTAAFEGKTRGLKTVLVYRVRGRLVASVT